MRYINTLPLPFSIYDPYIDYKKMKSKPFNQIQWKRPKSWNVITEKFINHFCNSQIWASQCIVITYLRDRLQKTYLVCMNKSLKRGRPLWKIGEREKISDISSYKKIKQNKLFRGKAIALQYGEWNAYFLNGF